MMVGEIGRDEKGRKGNRLEGFTMLQTPFGKKEEIKKVQGGKRKEESEEEEGRKKGRDKRQMDLRK